MCTHTHKCTKIRKEQGLQTPVSVHQSASTSTHLALAICGGIRKLEHKHTQAQTHMHKQTCMKARTPHTHTHTQTHTCTHTHTRRHTRAHTHTRTRAHTHTHTPGRLDTDADTLPLILALVLWLPPSLPADCRSTNRSNKWAHACV